MKIVLAILASFYFCLAATAEGIPELVYSGESLAGLAGDGKTLVKTSPEGFFSVRGKDISGHIKAATGPVTSVFFPGGVEYVCPDSTRILYGFLPGSGFIAAVQSACRPEIDLGGKNGNGLVLKTMHDGDGWLALVSERRISGRPGYSGFKEALYRPYSSGLVVETPDDTLDMAVQFSQYLLDLGYNGSFMLCELFRWLDIWARDLGSGLLPGALVSGRQLQGRQSLEYDLRRYALMSPQDCKNSNDPSQGGTAEGIGWTVRSIWNHYLNSGDTLALARDMSVMRPWVDFWAGRDYDGDGLVTDVTEFMDHMIMMLSTEGVVTLASNAMFSSMLHYSSLIEEELGNHEEAERYARLYDRTINAINTRFWNEDGGYFNNMLLWGLSSERSAQPSQSMLLKVGATDKARACSTLDHLRRTNWTDYGSMTIVPGMNHVPESNDQNMKIWPWWNLWESEARFNYGDIDGGYRLLHLAAATVGHKAYPGLMEETLDLQGNSYGGNAFPTAAGNLLDVVVKDLFGIQILAPGWKSIKAVPSVPYGWKSYSCRVPLPDGSVLSLSCDDGRLSIDAEGTPVDSVFTTEETVVIGAEKCLWRQEPEPQVDYEDVCAAPVPALSPGKAVLFHDDEFHSGQEVKAAWLPAVDVAGIADLPGSDVSYLVVPGNSLPLETKDGRPVKKLLEDFVSSGGYVVFYGAETNRKTDDDGAGILGEQCGIVDWKQYLPVRDKMFLVDWKSSSEDFPGYSDYIYRCSFALPERFAGDTLYLELGQMTGRDSVFINGQYAFGCDDMQDILCQEYPSATDYPDAHRYKRLSRLYMIPPDSQACFQLHQGDMVNLEVRIRHDRCREGMSVSCRPNIGVMTEGLSWQYTDEDIPGFGFEFPKRKGVNYWGNEQFFNSWSTRQGLFGFRVNGNGVSFQDGTILGGMPDVDIPVASAYTDFALFAPSLFEVMAFTTTNDRLLYPSETERYPCAVRVVRGKGGYILIAPELTEGLLGEEILRRLTE